MARLQSRELMMQREVDVPADDARAVVGRHFAELEGWAPPIRASSLDASAPAVGATRTCHILGLEPLRPDVVRERLLRYDDTA